MLPEQRVELAIFLVCGCYFSRFVAHCVNWINTDQISLSHIQRNEQDRRKTLTFADMT